MDKFYIQHKSAEASQVEEGIDGYYTYKGQHELLKKEKYLTGGHQVDHEGSGWTTLCPVLD